MKVTATTAAVPAAPTLAKRLFIVMQKKETIQRSAKKL
jgi:hypothetical protein